MEDYLTGSLSPKQRKGIMSDQISEFDGLVTASCLPSSPSLSASICCGYLLMGSPFSVGSCADRWLSY